MFRRFLVRSLDLGSRSSRSRSLSTLVRHERKLILQPRCLQPAFVRTHTEHVQHETTLKQSGQPAKDANLNSGSKRLSVRFGDGEVCEYPYVWLRDNCQCEKCFHPTTMSRLVLMKDLDIKSEPKSVEIQDGGHRLLLTWPDGHVSTYSSQWLQDRAFNSRAQSKRNEMYGKTHVKWGAEMKDKLLYFDFEKVMVDDSVLLAWLTQMETYGISMLTNALAHDSLVRLGDRVGMLRRTNYGETFEVMSKENPSNLAYTSAALGLHCDLPFYSAIPGIQFLHFVKNEAKGGANQFADASHAADQLKEMRPELFDLLSNTLIDFYDIGTDYFSFHMLHRHPVIRHDYQGDVIGYAYNNQVRDTYLNVPLDKVQPIYEGMKLLNEIMYDDKNRIDVNMETGHMVVFDNIRVLHGRSEYYGGHRHLVGVYMDWCDVRSKIRLLRAQLEG